MEGWNDEITRNFSHELLDLMESYMQKGITYDGMMFSLITALMGSCFVSGMKESREGLENIHNMLEKYHHGYVKEKMRVV